MRPDEAHPRLRWLLASGGDERIWPDLETGRNRYGITIAPAPDELWFSSSTASAMTEHAYGEAGRIAARLFDAESQGGLALQDWFDAIRGELLATFGCEAAQAVLAPSGTDGELIALAVAKSLLGPAVTNIVIAPDETGSGVTKAAAGLNFLATSSLGGSADLGRRLGGWEAADIEVACVGIRDADGAPRPLGLVDADVARHVESALAGGRGVLLHVLDTSKTGLSGPSRAVAWRLARGAPDRVLVVVDACQLRCPAAQLQSDLRAGGMVLISGSKFVAGPPFSGALLLPGEIAARLRQAPPPPVGLADYSARFDWPEGLQATFARELIATANFGLGLRWSAALAELRRLVRVGDAQRSAITARFANEVLQRASATPRLAPLDEPDAARNSSIVPLAVRSASGGFAPAAAVAKLHVDLRWPIGVARHLQRVCHVGQPVQLGPRTALRVCLSAGHVSAVAEGLAAGATLDDAFAPIGRDLDRLFAKLMALIDGASP